LERYQQNQPLQGSAAPAGLSGQILGKSPPGACVELYGHGIADKAARAGSEMPWGAIQVKTNSEKRIRRRMYF